MEELARVLREHFSCDENTPQLGTSAGAVMVFTSMRNAVTDICNRLNDLDGVNIIARCDCLTLGTAPLRIQGAPIRSVHLLT